MRIRSRHIVFVGEAVCAAERVAAIDEDSADGRATGARANAAGYDVSDNSIAGSAISKTVLDDGAADAIAAATGGSITTVGDGGIKAVVGAGGCSAVTKTARSGGGAQTIVQGAAAIAIVGCGCIKANAVAANPVTIVHGNAIDAIATNAGAVAVINRITVDTPTDRGFTTAIGDLIATDSGVATVNGGTTTNRRGVDAVKAARPYRAVFYNVSIANPNRYTMIQTAQNGDAGNKDVDQIATGSVDTITKTRAGIDARTVIGNPALNKTVLDSQVF